MTTIALGNPFRAALDRREQARAAEIQQARQQAYERGYTKGLHAEPVNFAYIAWSQKVSRIFGWVTVTWHPDPTESEAVIKSFLDGYMMGRQGRESALEGPLAGSGVVQP